MPEGYPRKKEVRRQAFEILAEWNDYFDPEYSTDGTSKQAFLADLEKYSPTGGSFESIRDAHDHRLYIFSPSIGDEAGYWTLYVIVSSGGGYGFVDDEMAAAIGTNVIRAVWQVFDTMPQQVYTLEEEWDEGKKHTISKPTWHGIPA